MSNKAAIPSKNGAVITISQMIKAIMSSAAEAELGSIFVNCQEVIPAHQELEIKAHNQPPTPMQTHNSTALVVVTNNIARKRLKTMDMKIHWLR